MLRSFLEQAGGAAAALSLTGEAGAGKTTLWRAGVEAARELSLRVVSAAPVEVETKLSFAALGDLLEPVLAEVLPVLPAQLTAALKAALLLEEQPDEAPDQRAVSVALLAALRALAAASPLLIAVDDVQWLDGPSSGALAYAARRLPGEQVRFLLARRVTGMDELPPLEHALGEHLQRLSVGPLTLGALHRLLHARLGAPVARPALVRIQAVSQGNPFFALELARAHQLEPDALLTGSELPLTLDALVRGRLDALPTPTRRALAVAAAASHPTVDLVGRVIDVDALEALAPAVTANVIALQDGRVAFTHPLLASGVTAADVTERREVHVRLAALASDLEERGRHLALAATGPDEAIALALDRAAMRALARGAPAVAAELCERAARLTPAGRQADQRRRRLAAAVHHFESGDGRRARSILEELVLELPPGAVRAGVLVFLARVRSYGDDIRAAIDLYTQAIAEAGEDELVRARAREGVAVTLFRLRERFAEGVEHANAAIGLAHGLGDGQLMAETLGTRLLCEAALGREETASTLAEALSHQPAAARSPLTRQPIFSVAVVWMWQEELERSRSTFEELKARSRDTGDEAGLPYALVLLAQVECVLGELDSAREHAAEAVEVAEQADQETVKAYALALCALADANAGRADGGRRHAEQALMLASSTAAAPAKEFATAALGLLELSLGRAAEAADRLRPLVAHAREHGVCEPGFSRYAIDLIEAAIELGRLEEATELLDWYEANAIRLGRSGAIASSARCRGLLLAAGGDLGGALLELARASAAHPENYFPVDRGRTLLALGAAQRRANRRREARATLGQALDQFERAGSAIWADRARAELERIGGRAPSGGLTPAEHRVAELVAAGGSNKEVAQALFVTVKTVEANLSRIYAKLGVRSRVELANKLGPKL